MSVHVTIVTHDLAENALGRAYCLWLVCRHLGHVVRVVGPQRGPFWPPLLDSEFSEDCWRVARWPERDGDFEFALARSDLVIAVKTWPASLGAALSTCRRVGTPLVVDIDEDDYNALLGLDANAARRAKSAIRLPMRGTSPLAFKRLQKVAREDALLRFVSSPTLLDRFPNSIVVPHARPISPFPRKHRPGPLSVAFVGTIRQHKGVETLREAVNRLGGDVQLVVTASPPRDAQPNEHWIGVTSLESGRAVLATCDVLVAASTQGGYGATQVPAKLIDAMSVGVVPVGSDTPPIRWALDDGKAGVLLESNSPASISGALASLLDANERNRLSGYGHSYARRHYSVDAVARTVGPALEKAAQ